jgi:HEAT repeat protein
MECRNHDDYHEWEREKVEYTANLLELADQGEFDQLAIELLREEMRTSDGPLHFWGSLILVRLGLADKTNIYSLAENISDTVDQDITELVQQALLDLGSAAVEPLIDELQDEHNLQYDIAYASEQRIRVLGEIGDKRAVPILIEVLEKKGAFCVLTSDSPDPDRYTDIYGICAEAARALGKIGDERAIEPLIAALATEDQEERIAIAEALVKFGDKRAVEPLISALKTNDWYLSFPAAEALGELGDSRAIQPLIEAMQGLEGHEREPYIEALKKLGHEVEKPDA